MNHIDSIKINGFWKNKKLELQLFKDASFLIGVNGSGKTTLINLIAAILTLDVRIIRKIDFDEVEIIFQEYRGKKKPSLKVIKNYDSEFDKGRIAYFIKQSSRAEVERYTIDESQEDMLADEHSAYSDSRKKYILRELVEAIDSLVNMSWLSVHRSKKTYSYLESHFNEEYKSSVDRKLNDQSIEIAKYFNSLTNKVSKEVLEYQQNIIVSLITDQSAKSIFSSVNKLNLEQEEEDLLTIFTDLNMGSSKQNRLRKYFQNVHKVLKNRSEDGSFPADQLGLDDFMYILSLHRSHKVIEDWSKLQKTKEKIIHPKTIFLEIVNSLFQRKTLFLNERNEMYVETESGKVLSVENLSSGEKQLLILLGEALLQESKCWVYMADEPELSLHIVWQEKLMQNLLRINPNAQIFCATHSPDIVSGFYENVIDMESQIR